MNASTRTDTQACEICMFVTSDEPVYYLCRTIRDCKFFFFFSPLTSCDFEWYFSFLFFCFCFALFVCFVQLFLLLSVYVLVCLLLLLLFR